MQVAPVQITTTRIPTLQRIPTHPALVSAVQVGTARIGTPPKQLCTARVATPPGTGRIGTPPRAATSLVSAPLAASPLPATGRGRLVTRHLSSDFVRKHYQEIRELGKGSFGKITLVKERATGQERVCKFVSTVGMDARNLELTRKEIQLMCDLDHPRVVKLYEYAEDSARQEIVMVLEYLPGGDCLGLIANSQNVEEELVSRIISQSLVALGHCHQQGIYHRDVKLENLMLSSEPRGNLPDCKLIDFGLGTRSDEMLREVLGTPAYIAPEVKRAEGYTPMADIWSLGVCAFELLTGGILPFGKPEDYSGRMEPVLERVERYRNFEELNTILMSSPVWATRSKEAKDFVRWLLAPDSRRRPSAAQALQHPWLQMHKVQDSGLSTEILQSLAAFASAPATVQSCLYAIAARTDLPGARQLGEAFLATDADGDGHVSLNDLNAAINSAKKWWDPEINVRRLFDAMDLGKSGSISFTTFLAACSHGTFCSLEDVLTTAFEALDERRCGVLSVQGVARLLPRCSPRVMQRLPQDRNFTVYDWVACIQMSSQVAVRAVQPRPRRASAPGLFDRFFCTGCHEEPIAEHLMAPVSVLPYSHVSCH